MGYAPADDPKIAVALIVENGGWGSTVAAPIARKVFDYWLAPDRQNVPEYVPSFLEDMAKEPGDESSPDVEVPEDAPVNPEDKKIPEAVPDILGPVTHQEQARREQLAPATPKVEG